MPEQLTSRKPQFYKPKIEQVGTTHRWARDSSACQPAHRKRRTNMFCLSVFHRMTYPINPRTAQKALQHEFLNMDPLSTLMINERSGKIVQRMQHSTVRPTSQIQKIPFRKFITYSATEQTVLDVILVVEQSKRIRSGSAMQQSKVGAHYCPTTEWLATSLVRLDRQTSAYIGARDAWPILLFPSVLLSRTSNEQQQYALACGNPRQCRRQTKGVLRV